MLRHAILALLSIATVSCSNPRVAVTFEEASIRTVENGALFSGYLPARLRHVPRQVVAFRISSRTDLFEYFKDWDRQIQVRCSVDGSANGKAYRSVGFGPWLDASRSSTSTPGNHDYLVYAFVDLKAHDVEYAHGKPATTLDLKADRFESLGCRIVGVQMGSVIFPRSNDFVVSAQAFHALVRKRSVQ